ncbi:nucleotidyltransferase family protein [Clostridium sp. PL3]|uniref:Nucleotidyltransferase family protein n=1 Tax=Clostridium thailandense TaxID=2794346 RepID=A0A949WPM6_9CLOT|nr:nucleotidyltransferase family protein [Clostridium thailandense]MBV7271521.1 nucleotidyltransferase family protein [Clostridium thailandense]
MNNNQQTLVHLLNAAIHGRRVNNNEIDNINWSTVFEITKEQDIYALLYPIIKDIDDNLKPNNEIMNEWKKTTILASLNQAQNSNKIISVLRALNEAKIRVIGLKGLVLRELYPVKELRTMSDTDILIHVEDLDKVEEILLNLGYFEDHRDLKHILFLHKQFFPIELHWLAIDMNYFKNADYLEKDIWENNEKINIGGATILIPSLENQILYLCLHMAVHFANTGFGLRQLCDLVILVETEVHKVNWNSFYEKVVRCKIKNFVFAIFEVCRRLFHMVIPNILYNKDLENNEYIDMIIDSVLAEGVYGGIYGKVRLGPADDNLLFYYESNRQYYSLTGKLKYLIEFFFPMPHKLSRRYSYARDYPICIPLAWLHRLIYGIFRKDYNICEKSILLLSQSDFLRKRINLFKWLDL